MLKGNLVRTKPYAIPLRCDTTIVSIAHLIAHLSNPPIGVFLYYTNMIKELQVRQGSATSQGSTRRKQGYRSALTTITQGK
jgi:hypothetical protein